MATKKTTKSSTKKNTSPSNPQPLYRSESNQIIAGVAGGLGEYFQLDPTLIRIVFLLLLFFGGSGALIYFVLWLVMPLESKISSDNQATIRNNTQEMRDKAQVFSQTFSNKSKQDNRQLAGIIILVLGIFFLLSNLGIISWFSLERFWPLILIAIGFFILFKRHES